MRTPRVDRQIPEQAKTHRIAKYHVVKKVMLGQAVEGEFTTLEDVAEVAPLFASFPTNAVTGQSITESPGWNME